jgi:soluble lytic murein transglycosylase-like protein
VRLRWKRWILGAGALVVIAGIVAAALYYQRSGPTSAEESELPRKAEAPPDLQKLRDVYTAGMAALAKKDGAEAVRLLSSFTFGPRAVEEYRLYSLASAYELAGRPDAARIALAKLWRRTPRMVFAKDVAFDLAKLYAQDGEAARSANVYAAAARKSDDPAFAATARWNTVVQRVQAGDPAGALYMARSILIHNPRAKEAKDAVAVVRALTGTTDQDVLPLTPSERLDRATALMYSQDPQTALEELTALGQGSAQLHLQIQVQKGIALQLLRRYEDSNKVLEPLTDGPYKYAIPALRYAAKNYAVVAASINPEVIKTVKEKKKVGTVKQRVGKGKKRRTVTKPKYQIVSKQVKLVDLAKKKKKDEYERLASERLKDILLLPIDDDLRLEVLNALIARAASKNQDAYVQQLVPQAIKLDPASDPALQHFWDKGWAAYARGDLAGARTLFGFIAGTYTHPNVRRQSEYWYARTLDRQGQKAEAAAIYQKLASAPYADLYALHSVKRGAKRQPNTTNPLKKEGPDWRELAEKEMPPELELAYELTALSSLREAAEEIRRNTRRQNVRFAEALTAEAHYAAGNEILMYRSLKRAWPQLATVEQDTVPANFLKMYYPIKYGEEIEKRARERGLDPNLVRALILQESYYNPAAKSRVGATGLMQLMPPTAKDHAARLHIPFAASRLTSPDVNIRLGTFHLKMLVDLFQGNTFLAIASYNAGQGNVMKWRRAAPGKPTDELLESIPFPETRNYVKRVTMLESAYSRLTL